MNLNELKKLLEEMPESKIQKLSEYVDQSDRVYLLGNGGSSAICSHISQDYTKALGKSSVTFDNSSQLTCYANDFGQEEAYAKWLEHMTKEKYPLIILVSSSGNSDNILRCAKWCSEKHHDFILLTGFDKNNLCRQNFGKQALFDYWVDSKDYGIVECLHQIFLHAVI